MSNESSGRFLIDFWKHFRLGWSHYRLLLGQGDPVRRRFYFEQAAGQRWTVRELRRQTDRGLFERVTLSKDTRQLVAQEKRKGPTEVVRHEDVFKDPYVLDFLGLKGSYSEKDLESAIIRNLEQFLSELGTDFCFIGRQYAMRIDDDDYFLDLLFYHRGLHCLVAIDLKGRRDLTPTIDATVRDKALAGIRWCEAASSIKGGKPIQTNSGRCRSRQHRF